MRADIAAFNSVYVLEWNLMVKKFFFTFPEEIDESGDCISFFFPIFDKKFKNGQILKKFFVLIKTKRKF